MIQSILYNCSLVTCLSVDRFYICEYDVGRKYTKILVCKAHESSSVFIYLFIFSDFSTINIYCLYYPKTKN